VIVSTRTRRRLACECAPCALLVLSLLALGPFEARGATVAYLTDGELVARATRIVHGRVDHVWTEADAAGTIRTLARIAVVEDLTGVDEAWVEVQQLGGTLGGTTLSVPGAALLPPGAEVLACLEPAGQGPRFKLVALGFSLFAVEPGVPADLDAGLRRQDEGLTVLDRPVLDGRSRTLGEFRRVVSAVRGTASVWPGPLAPVSGDERAVAGVASATDVVSANFTLLGGGVRWNEVDAGAVLAWYRNTAAPAPVDGSNGDTEILTAVGAWTDPPGASIVLTYGGTRGIGADSPYCGPSNLGAGLISFEDPTNEIGSGVLALGGGCTTTAGRKVINGSAFDSFTHGFVVFNRSAEVGATFRSPLNFSRIVQHEIGHGIGLGHTPTTITGAQSNIMYPSCCSSATPVPPVLGPDDLAGLRFIYPEALVCSIAVSPATARVPAAGGSLTLTIDANAASCEWTLSTDQPWIALPATASGQGDAQVSVIVSENSGEERTGRVFVNDLRVLITQEVADADADGLLDHYELSTGLNPFSAEGADGPFGDPDGDGRTNLQEQADRTHARGFYRRYLAEGALGQFFWTEVALFTPSASDARVSWRYEVAPPRPCQGFCVLPARRPVLYNPAGCFSAPELDGTIEVSGLFESDQPFVVERTMSWPRSGAPGWWSNPTRDAYGAHAETAVAVPARTWHFAEGATHSGFNLFFLVKNTESRAVAVTATYLRPAPLAPVVKSYEIAAGARRTIWANYEDAGLAATDVATSFSSDGLIVAERAMYRDAPGEPLSAGHAGAGVPMPATSWWFAEGVTSDVFSTFLLISNPGASPVEVRIQYLLNDGTTLSRALVVEAFSRANVWVNVEDERLARAEFGVEIEADQPGVVAERAVWWPGPLAASWNESHVTAGSSARARRWFTAGGEAGGERGAATFLLLLNPSPSAATVQVTTVFEDGSRTSEIVGLPARSRTTYDVGGRVPQAPGRRFAAEIEVLDGDASGIVVERATYWDSRTHRWAAGVALLAAPQP
jgi:hypothetical protein